MKRFIYVAIVAVFATLSLTGFTNDSEVNPEMVAVEGTGIKFKKINFEKALLEAKKTGKLIFIDCYTDWCGPCKRMAATAFKDQSVGKTYNDKFINLKIEMEKNPDGAKLSRQYRISAYPTLLFINKDGKVVKKAIGMQNAAQLKNIANSLK